MKEEMLAEVASPAITPELRLKMKQRRVQPGVQSRERVNGRKRQVLPVFGLVCLHLGPKNPLPSVPSTNRPSMRQETTTTTVVVVGGSTTIFRSLLEFLPPF